MKTVLFLILVLLLVTSLTPNVFAEVHPLQTVEIFDSPNQTWCYEYSELNKVTLDGSTNKADTIQDLMEIIRQEFSNNSNMNISSSGTCEQNDVDDAITSYIANNDDVIAAVTPWGYFPESQQKLLMYNILRTDLVSTGKCIEGEKEDILFSPVTEHELGHFAGLDHLKPKGSTSDETLMGDDYRCMPTKLTSGDISQINSLYPITKTQIIIPDWINLNANWWAKDIISDKIFLDAIKYLTEQGIIQLGEITPSSTPSNDLIPDWIKNNARWWADGKISDKEFADALKYLIENGVIFYNTQTQSMALSETSLYGTIAVTITPDKSADYPPYCEPNCVHPKIATIQAGETVQFLNNHHRPHTFTSGHPSYGPDGLFNSLLIPSGESFQYTYEQKGNYEYFCIIHPWMQGVIIVK